MNSFCQERVLYSLLATILVALALSCERSADSPQGPEFTDDETYLIESYVKIRRARGFYPHEEERADSLLSFLAGEIDTVRIDRIASRLNRTPDRWLLIYQEIENRLKQPTAEPDSLE